MRRAPRCDACHPGDDNGGMSDRDEPSAFAYIFSAALGALALGATAWIGMRGRQNGGLGMPARRDPRPAPDLTVGDAVGDADSKTREDVQ